MVINLLIAFFSMSQYYSLPTCTRRINAESVLIRRAYGVPPIEFPFNLYTNVYFRLPFFVRLRGGKDGDASNVRKRSRSHKESVNGGSKANTLLYQSGDTGFGKVKLAPELQDDDENGFTYGVPDGTTPMLEVNLTEPTETEIRPKSKFSKQEPSRKDWYCRSILVLSCIFCFIGGCYRIYFSAECSATGGRMRLEKRL